MAGPSNPISEQEASRIAAQCIAAASVEFKLNLRHQLVAVEDERNGDAQLKLALSALLYKSTIPIETQLNRMGFTSAGPMSSSDAAQQLAAVKSASDISATPQRRATTQQRASAAPKKGPQYRLNVPALDVSQARQNVGTFGVLSPSTTRQSSVIQNAVMLPQQVPPFQFSRRQTLEVSGPAQPLPSHREPSTNPAQPQPQVLPPPQPLPTTTARLPSPLPPIPPSKQELTARLLLRHGIPMPLALNNHICPKHRHHLTTLILKAQQGGPHPATWQSLMPFYDSTTYDTALFPVCRACALATGAVMTTTTTTEVDGRVTLVVRRGVDTCTCASRIVYGRSFLGLEEEVERGAHCLHCEQRGIEDAKGQARILRQARHAGDGETPLVTGEWKWDWPVLNCACGKPCCAQDVVRRCVGCGGIKTAPYSNFRGDAIAFTAGTVEVETLIWAAAELGDPPITLPELVDSYRQNAIVDRHGRLLAAQDVLAAAAARKPPLSRTASLSSPRAARPRRPARAPNESPLFTSPETRTLRRLGIKVRTHYRKTHSPPSALQRAQILLSDNQKVEKMSGEWLDVMSICGCVQEDMNALPGDGWEVGDGVLTGEVVLGMVESVVRGRGSHPSVVRSLQ